MTTTTRRRDRRLVAIVATLTGVLLLGAVLRGGDRGGVDPAPASPEVSSSAVAADPHQAEIRRRFEQAVVMLHARQYEHALTALHRVLTLAPRMPEAHANMGFALMGLARHEEARGFFEAASDLNPGQANAYYGLALALEAGGELPAARGAMRSYLHLARHEDEAHLRRARAALWEWEQAAGSTEPRPPYR